MLLGHQHIYDVYNLLEMPIINLLTLLIVNRRCLRAWSGGVLARIQDRRSGDCVVAESLSGCSPPLQAYGPISAPHTLVAHVDETGGRQPSR